MAQIKRARWSPGARGVGGAATRKKTAAHHRLRPMRQGDLDGLCGVYSIVNAARLLAPKLGEKGTKQLFANLMQAVRRLDRGAKTIVHNGLERDQLGQLIEAMQAHMAKKHGVGIVVRHVPPDLRREWSVATLWRWLGRGLTSRSVAILGLHGRHDHWTLAVAVTPGQIALYDSDRLRVLRRSQCAVSGRRGRGLNIINAADVILLSCKGSRQMQA